MANIAIKLAKDRFSSMPAKALLSLARQSGISPTQIKKHVEMGKPFLNVELFMNDHVEIAQTMRNIMALDREHSLRLMYFEMQHQGDPDESEEIGREIVENTLREAD